MIQLTSAQLLHSKMSLKEDKKRRGLKAPVTNSLSAFGMQKYLGN